MAIGWNAEIPLGEPMPTTRLRAHAARLLSWLCARNGVNEAVATRISFDCSPEEVWNHLLFYEEVPGRPAFLLRTMLPCPVRTEGDKTRVGATVLCTYRGGDLAKRIITIEPPRRLQFEVIEQRLGIEGCILARGGSYQIEAQANACDVVLITNYRAHLRPRYLWHPLEALLVTELHLHILHGIRAAVRPRSPALGPAVAESPPSPGVPAGVVPCTSHSSSRR